MATFNCRCGSIIGLNVVSLRYSADVIGDTSLEKFLDDAPRMVLDVCGEECSGKNGTGNLFG